MTPVSLANAPGDRIESGPTQPLYLTAAQVADLLQVSPKTVYRLAKADASLPTLEIGGVIRFPKDRLLRWLRDREQGQRSGHQIRHQMLALSNPALGKEAARG